MTRVGILGGTFNPPHVGHLVCAQEAHLQLGLDQVVLVPARIPPHKPVEEEPGARHRLELCRAAIDGDPRFTVSDLEMIRDGVSYTVDTLQALTRKAPDSQLFMIVGGDVAAGFPRWREPERVLSLATLAVAMRSGTARTRVTQALHSLPGGDRAVFFRMPRIAISSTFVRDRVRQQEPIRYFVPDAVAAYIERHRLYQEPNTA